MAEHYQPWTWKIPESDESIKRNMVPRQDAYERVSGQAVYTRDALREDSHFALRSCKNLEHGHQPSRSARRRKGHTQI